MWFRLLSTAYGYVPVGGLTFWPLSPLFAPIVCGWRVPAGPLFETNPPKKRTLPAPSGWLPQRPYYNFAGTKSFVGAVLDVVV